MPGLLIILDKLDIKSVMEAVYFQHFSRPTYQVNLDKPNIKPTVQKAEMFGFS